ncbi:MAG: hypothetical protein C0407_11315, partial [Desulfobacca sp.]|nr:hypothetical protein [Desulfobacca sp.]
MSTIPVHFHEVIRFYERVNKLKPASLSDRLRSNNQDLINISAEAKKKLVFDQARNEVLEKLKK